MSGPFAIGDAVTWTSSSAGRTTTKDGTVTMVIPPGGFPVGIRNPGMTRDHPSYIVRVKGRGLYWPRAAALRWATGGTP